MIVYKGTKAGFLDDVIDGRIAKEIETAFVAKLGRHTSENEVRSWENSMQHMYKVLNASSVSDQVSVAIEYQIPLTSKRIDFMLAGVDENGKENVVIVELKQWDHAKLTTKPAVVITRFQHGESEVTHPSYQAWSYATAIQSFNSEIQDRGVGFAPCAFLHNYRPDDVITNPIYADYIERAPVFLKNDVRKLANFISHHVKHASKADLVFCIESGKLRPAKQLADVLASMFKGNQEFTLLDDQLVVYETALEIIKNSVRGDKTVYIVKGGPGTGKSVVAMNLLVEATKLGLAAQYVSKNSAPREVYASKLSGSMKKGLISNLFIGSGSFVGAPKDAFQTLIVDEAHRLNEKSGLYGNLGENQLKEIINAARSVIFFVDDNQRVHVRDIGSVASIKRMAESMGVKVVQGELMSQFRCNGSDGYLSWLDNSLQIAETANIKLNSADYDFKVYDDPNEMFESIREKNKINNKSRVVAGYCWKWNSKHNAAAFDVEIPECGFKKRWNLSEDGNLWIIKDGTIDEVGCIHTCQGLELDYVGVIVGPDIRLINGKIVTDVTTHPASDQAVKGLKGKIRNKKNTQVREGGLRLADMIIKNTYRTLMTRGMKGCYVYFCDRALGEYFKSRIDEVPVVLPALRPDYDRKIQVEPSVNEEVRYIDFLPLYSLRAACGYFGEGESVEGEGWIKVEGMGRLNRNMFVARAAGRSMEPLIHDGDYCVFRANPAGSRIGKIVLAQHHSLYDSDAGGAFTIKEYSSRKRYNEFGEWQHEEIVLRPRNRDFNPIVIPAEQSDDFRIIAEFVGVIRAGAKEGRG